MRSATPLEPSEPAEESPPRLSGSTPLASFRRILCALGGTRSSETALSFAVDLARSTHGTVDVVHPLPRARLEPGRPAESANELRAWHDAVRDIEHRIQRAAPLADVPVYPHVRSGRLAQVIAFVAESEGAELVVVSRHTLIALREETLDEELFALEGEGSPPLLVLPEGSRWNLPTGRRCRVLAPLLDSDHAGRPALYIADALSAALGGELFVSHAGERFSSRALASLAEEAAADVVVVEKPDGSRLLRALSGRGPGERLVERSQRPVLLVNGRTPVAAAEDRPHSHAFVPDEGGYHRQPGGQHEGPEPYERPRAPALQPRA